eukprot:SAG31_NODE_796_length_12032_cov_21.073242_12_plen_69_part_00
MGLNVRLKPQQVRDTKGRVINDGGPVWFGGILPFQNAIRTHFVPATQLYVFLRFFSVDISWLQFSGCS